MTRETRDLTPRQHEVLVALCRWLDEHGFPPSVRELGEALGLSSTRTIHDHLEALERKGYIRRHRDRSRALEVLAGLVDGSGNAVRPRRSSALAPGARGVRPAAGPRTAQLRGRRLGPVSAVRVPIVGEVAAGMPILAVENLDGELELDASLVPDPQTFLLRVRGSSMIDAHVCDGDLVMVRPKPEARDGEVVVVLIDDTVTLKRFFRRDGYIELRPENPSMASILVTPEVGDVRILGTLAGVIRRY